MHIWQQLVVIFLLPFLSCAVLAQQGKGISVYTVEDLVAQSLAISDQLNAQRSRILEKFEAAEQAGAWANPTLSLGGGAKKDEINLGAVFHVKVSQNFSLGKQGLRRDVARVDSQLKEIEIVESELAIIAEVTRLAFDYALYKRKVEFAHARHSRFSLLYTYLAGHTFVSPQQKATSLAVKDRLRNLEADEKRLEGDLKKILAELSMYVADNSFDSNATIRVPWLDGKRALDLEDWIARTLANNPTLTKQRAEIGRGLSEEALFKRERWPDFSLSAFFEQETLATTERIFGLEIGFGLPLWNRNQAALRSSGHKLVAEKYVMSLQERQLVAAVKKQLSAYDASRKIALLYPESALAKLEVDLKEMEREFRKNRVDFLLFLDLDVQAAETVNRILDAQRELLDAITKLHVLSRDKNLPSAIASF